MTSGDPRIDWAVAHIENSLDRPLRIAEIARAVNLSTSRFTRLFREATGDSPARYLQVRRLERARVLIETTFFTIKEVMVKVGFNDPSHFTRYFSRHYGISPTGIRASRARRQVEGHGPAGE
jgi:transcriptional regulator GlxA family with amidase domain